jgi:hypothetical protein
VIGGVRYLTITDSHPSQTENAIIELMSSKQFKAIDPQDASEYTIFIRVGP